MSSGDVGWDAVAKEVNGLIITGVYYSAGPLIAGITERHIGWRKDAR